TVVPIDYRKCKVPLQLCDLHRMELESLADRQAVSRFLEGVRKLTGLARTAPLPARKTPWAKDPAGVAESILGNPVRHSVDVSAKVPGLRAHERLSSALSKHLAVSEETLWLVESGLMTRPGQIMVRLLHMPRPTMKVLEAQLADVI